MANRSQQQQQLRAGATTATDPAHQLIVRALGLHHANSSGCTALFFTRTLDSLRHDLDSSYELRQRDFDLKNLRFLLPYIEEDFFFHKKRQFRNFFVRKVKRMLNLKKLRSDKISEWKICLCISQG